MSFEDSCFYYFNYLCQSLCIQGLVYPITLFVDLGPALSSTGFSGIISTARGNNFTSTSLHPQRFMKRL